MYPDFRDAQGCMEIYSWKAANPRLGGSMGSGIGEVPGGNLQINLQVPGA